MLAHPAPSAGGLYPLRWWILSPLLVGPGPVLSQTLNGVCSYLDSIFAPPYTSLLPADPLRIPKPCFDPAVNIRNLATCPAFAAKVPKPSGVTHVEGACPTTTALPAHAVAARHQQPLEVVHERNVHQLEQVRAHVHPQSCSNTGGNRAQRPQFACQVWNNVQ